MKPRSCVICGSESNLFSFPKADSERKKWADELKIDFKSIKLSINKVCKKHFSPEQFKYSNQKQLNPGAVPSLNVFSEDDRSIEEPKEVDASHENNKNEHKEMCLSCGYVSAARFFRFPKNLSLRKEWAEFCYVKTADIKEYHRLCNKHFQFEHERNKRPTLYRKEYCDRETAVNNYNFVGTNCGNYIVIECENTVNEAVNKSNVDDTNCRNNIIESECENTVNEAVNNGDVVDISCGDVVRDCEHEKIVTECDVPRNETTPKCSRAPLIYFRKYGDIKEDDVITPRRAKLALRMGKAEIEKCRQKWRYLQKENYRLKIKITTLQDELTDLQKNNLLTKGAVQNILNAIPDFMKDAIIRMLRHIKKVDPKAATTFNFEIEKGEKGNKYSPQIREFAMSIQFYSSRAYEYVREKFWNVLPHPGTITRWFQTIDGKPGFTTESFTTLKNITSIYHNDSTVVCNICIDEISIKQKPEYVNGRQYGYIYNGGTESKSDCQTWASHMLTFLAVGLKSRWKVPLGYFPIHSLDGTERANLLTMCLQLTHETGVTVRSVTFDGAPTNKSMVFAMGANFDYGTPNYQPWFAHPCTKERVYTLLDPCHMLKLVRNCLGDLGPFYVLPEKKEEIEKVVHVQTETKQKVPKASARKRKGPLATQEENQNTTKSKQPQKRNPKNEIENRSMTPAMTEYETEAAIPTTSEFVKDGIIHTAIAFEKEEVISTCENESKKPVRKRKQINTKLADEPATKKKRNLRQKPSVEKSESVHTKEESIAEKKIVSTKKKTFVEEEKFVGTKENEISWKYFVKLVERQEEEGLHLANKLTRRHLRYNDAKMNVRLATQTLSCSVADALETLAGLESDFVHASATADFCRNFNDGFDILNCRNVYSTNKFQKPLDDRNYELLKKRATEVINFITRLRSQDGVDILRADRPTGFLGFIMCLENLFSLYEEFKNKDGMTFLLSYKLLQDHLENFFSAIRSHGGFNDNPTCRQFEAAYKKLLVHAEITISRRSGVQGWNEIEILKCSSAKPKNADSILNEDINFTNEAESFFKSTANFGEHDYVASCWSLSMFALFVVHYISGFIVRRIRKVITCKICERCILADKDTRIQYDLLTRKKNRGGLIFPSEDVYEICTFAERTFREQIGDMDKKNFVPQLTMLILRKTGDKFFVKSPHMFSQEVLSDHRYQLMKLIIQSYVEVRVRYELGLIAELKFDKRRTYHKYIHFGEATRFRTKGAATTKKSYEV